MEISKIRNLGDQELRVEETRAAEQRFRLRFQLSLGQKEGVKKLRELKKDIARIKTIERERSLGIRGAAAVAAGELESKSKSKKGTR